MDRTYCSLLVVDDNPTNRDLLTRQLARHGYIVAAAAVVVMSEDRAKADGIAPIARITGAASH